MNIAETVAALRPELLRNEQRFVAVQCSRGSYFRAIPRDCVGCILPYIGGRMRLAPNVLATAQATRDNLYTMYNATPRAGAGPKISWAALQVAHPELCRGWDTTRPAHFCICMRDYGMDCSLSRVTCITPHAHRGEDLVGTTEYIKQYCQVMGFGAVSMRPLCMLPCGLSLWVVLVNLIGSHDQQHWIILADRHQCMRCSMRPGTGLYATDGIAEVTGIPINDRMLVDDYGCVLNVGELAAFIPEMYSCCWCFVE